MSGAISGVEALARWHPPRRSVIAACNFLPLLERNGLMGRLGHLMLSDALATLSQWDSKGMLVPTMSINMSNTELRNP